MQRIEVAMTADETLQPVVNVVELDAKFADQFDDALNALSR